MKNFSFRTKMLVLILPITVAGLLAMTFISFKYFQSVLEKEIKAGTEQNVAESSANINAWLEARLLEVQTTSRTPTARNIGNDPNAANKMNEYRLKLMNEKFPDVYNSVSWGYFDNSGTLSGQAATGPSINNVKSRAWYTEAMTGNKSSFISPPIISQWTGKMIVNCISLIKNDVDENIGMVLAAIDVQAVSDKVAAMNFGEKGFGMLIAQDGTFIVHPNSEYIMKQKITEVDDVQIRELGKFMLSGEAGIYNLKEKSENKIVFYQPIPIAGWSVAAVVDEAELLAPAKRILWTMITISLIIIAFLVAMIVFFANYLVVPLRIMMESVDEMAAGDFQDKPRRMFSNDEFGRLGVSLARMRKNVCQLMKKVSVSSEHLASSSEELAATAEQSSQASNQVAGSIAAVTGGMSEQLAAVNKTIGVVENMSAGIEEMAATANLVADKSAQAAMTAQEGGKSVEQAVSQMSQIEKTTTVSAQVVAMLGERSKEIGQIIDTISGIAGQTNLLALNAAIEAARAGEQGKGFAVVAEEVRKLAEQSQEAAKQIAVLIGEIQNDTDKAVVAMSEGSEQVKIGSEVVRATGQAFGKISEIVMDVSGEAKGISNAIEEMAADSRHIVTAIQEIDKLSKRASDEAQTVSAATEQQAASMQEVRFASQNLSEMADELQQEIKKFQI